MSEEQLTEWAAIALFKERVNRDAPTSTLMLPADDFGIGDDCAVFNIPKERNVCVSVDSFYAGRHFPADADLFLVGYRAINAAASDLAAMGSEPIGFLADAGLPQEAQNAESITRLAEGMRVAALRCRMPLIGGNISATENLQLTLTVLGHNDRHHPPLRRGGAQAGDILFVSGRLGKAAGLAFACASPNSLTVHQAQLRAAYFCPQARIDLGRALTSLASSCIDISDGLASDLEHLLKCKTDVSGTDAKGQSEIGARVFVERLPVIRPASAAARLAALSGGDEYELLFTAPASRQKEIIRLADRLALSVTPIGEITSCGQCIFIGDNGEEIQPAGTGYQHF